MSKKEKFPDLEQKRIDIHHHFLPPFFVDALTQYKHPQAALTAGVKWTPLKSLVMMDETGIDTSVLSLSLPGVSFSSQVDSVILARRCNEFAAEMIEANSGRFAAFASLPVLDRDAALNEIDYVLDTLKFEGVMLLSNVLGRYVGSPEFDPILSELDRRKAIVFLHPNQTQEPGFNDYVEFPHDLSRALASLVETGAIERYPNIRYILACGGGTVPFIAARITVVGMDVQGSFIKIMRSYLQRVRTMKKMAYDLSATTDGYALRALISHAKTDHIMMGSNFPWTTVEVFNRQQQEFRNCIEGDFSVVEQIERSNALKFFSHFA